MAELDEKVIITEVDFATKKAERRWAVEADKGVPRFLRDCAKIAKDEDIRSVLVVTVDVADHVSWVHLMENEHDQALLTLTLDDVKDDMKAEVFKEYCDDEE